MRKVTFLLAIGCQLMAVGYTKAQVPVKPTHVIVVVEENYAYDEIIGNSLCPTLNAVSKMSNTALFNNYYAIEHPSEPNYLDMFSGKNQGITSDVSGQNGGPLSDCNLGASLIQKGYTFAGYSEDQPSLGFYNNDDPPIIPSTAPGLTGLEPLITIAFPLWMIFRIHILTDILPVLFSPILTTILRFPPLPG
jgi:Phosphoesterase family